MVLNLTNKLWRPVYDQVDNLLDHAAAEAILDGIHDPVYRRVAGLNSLLDYLHDREVWQWQE